MASECLWASDKECVTIDAMETKIYPFINDLVFKCAFGQQKNAKLLICLLNAILHRKGRKKIETVEILNPFNIQEFETDKLTIVDVKAKTKEEGWFSIEVQVAPPKSYVARSVYYLSKLYSNQLVEGDDFSKLARATGISILNFRLFPDIPKIQNVFRLKNVESGSELFDAFELHYIELPKVGDNLDVVPKTPFERWVHILKFSAHYCGSVNLPKWAEEEEGIAMAVHELERINADKQYRQLLEAREKSELVHRTLLTEARQEGHQEGRQEGRREGLRDGMQQGRKELVQKMLAKGKTPKEISELTDIPLPEVLRFAEANEQKSSPNKVSEVSKPFAKMKTGNAKTKRL